MPVLSGQGAAARLCSGLAARRFRQLRCGHCAHHSSRVRLSTTTTRGGHWRSGWTLLGLGGAGLAVAAAAHLRASEDDGRWPTRRLLHAQQQSAVAHAGGAPAIKEHARRVQPGVVAIRVELGASVSLALSIPRFVFYLAAQTLFRSSSVSSAVRLSAYPCSMHGSLMRRSRTDIPVKRRFLVGKRTLQVLQSVGAGFVIRADDGLILTNAHVVQEMVQGGRVSTLFVSSPYAIWH